MAIPSSKLANGYRYMLWAFLTNDVFIQPRFLMTRSPSTGQEQYSFPQQQRRFLHLITFSNRWISHQEKDKRDSGNICGVKKWKVFDPTLVCKQSTFCLWLSSSVCFPSYTTRWTRFKRNVFITLLPGWETKIYDGWENSSYSHIVYATEFWGLEIVHQKYCLNQE